MCNSKYSLLTKICTKWVKTHCMFLHSQFIELRQKYILCILWNNWLSNVSQYVLFVVHTTYLWLFSDMSIGIYGGINPLRYTTYWLVLLLCPINSDCSAAFVCYWHCKLLESLLVTKETFFSILYLSVPVVLFELGNCDVDFFVFRHHFNITSPKFLKFERVQNDDENF